VLLVTISPVADEVDILEVFVRYHCAIAERMVLLPHRSHPQIHSLLQALINEGLPLEVWPHDSTELRESELLTSAVHAVAERFSPTWILPMGVDEFLAPANNARGFASIRLELETSDTAFVQLLRWRTYIPTGVSPNKHVLKRIAKRRVVESPQYTRALLPGRMAPEIVVPHGSHSMNLPDGSPAPSCMNVAMCIAHFPVRSATQIMNKVLRGWPAHLANPARQAGESYQWHRLFERCRDKGEIPQSELLETAINYISPSHEHVADVELIDERLEIPEQARELHYDYSEPLPLQVLADTAERMAKAVADLKRNSVSNPDLSSH
jgi:hypothetical protein